MTPMTEGVTDRFGNVFVDDLETDTKSYFTGLIVNRPLKQHGQPEDVASVVSYLASKEAHFITGLGGRGYRCVVISRCPQMIL
ncbi:hypothetical protein M405DRAFT_935482 [Rhizopogon salebrosus TDB-379]|nr:hypothetical protein M405DRAFT_935482 [Rhizopogon salebrosus TDB-379]